MKTLKQRVRLAATLCLLIGAAIFVSAQPTRLPEEQVAAARAAYQEWVARQTDDAVHGRLSSAGPAPKVETHTKTSPALTLLGFFVCAISIVTFIQTFM